MRSAAVLAALLTVFVAQPAGAQRLRLAVSECGGAEQATWSCDTNEGTALNLLASVIAPAITMLTAQESILDFWFRVPVPDWWKIGTGQCRASQAAAVSFDGSATSCVDPMSEVGVMGGFLYLIGPRSDAGPEGPIDEYHTRLRTISAVEPAVPPEYGSVAEGEELFLFRLTIDRRNTVSTGACPGCGACAILWLSRVILAQPAGIGDFRYDHLESPMFYLQGDPFDHLNCPRVAARSSTWGQVKSLYR